MTKSINQTSEFRDKIAEIINVLVDNFQFLLQFDAGIAEMGKVVARIVQFGFVLGHSIQKTIHSISHMQWKGELVFMIDQKTWRKAVEHD